MKIQKSQLKKMILNEIMSLIPANIDNISPENIDKEILRISIIAELDATNLYEQLSEKANNKKLKKVLLDVAKEEKTHVGEFQSLLLELDSEYKNELEKGREEIEELTEKELMEADEILGLYSEKYGLYEISEKDNIKEVEYKGRTVKLNKIMPGDVKKFKVYVKNDKGNIVKVNFGQKGVRIKKDNPERRKSFRARHRCDTPGPKWKARYWACKTW